MTFIQPMLQTVDRVEYANLLELHEACKASPTIRTMNKRLTKAMEELDGNQKD